MSFIRAVAIVLCFADTVKFGFQGWQCAGQSLHVRDFILDVQDFVRKWEEKKLEDDSLLFQF